MMALLHAVSAKSLRRGESGDLEEAGCMLQFVYYVWMQRQSSTDENHK
jgi:hypothetical protein